MDLTPYPEENRRFARRELPIHCTLSWEGLREMKENQVEFRAADGLTQLRIIELDERAECIYIVNETGKISWPLKFQKLSDVHWRIQNGDLEFGPRAIDKMVPTWGNYIAGLLNHLGCDTLHV